MTDHARNEPRPGSRSTHVGVGEPLPPARTAEANAAPTLAPAAPADRIAVIVAHGMGQQAHFETLEEVAEILRAAEGRTSGTAPPVTVRIARLGERDLPRAEVRVTGGAPAAGGSGRPRDVHLYETYWAPLTEGKVTTAEAVRFLIGSGLRGMRHCGFLNWSFERYMFDRPIRFTIPPYTTLQFFAAVLVIAALVAINSIMAAVFASRTVAGSAGGWVSDAMLADLTADLALGLAGIFASVLIGTLVPKTFRRWVRAFAPDRVLVRGIGAVVSVVAWIFMLVALASIVATAAAMGWHAWVHLRGADAPLVTFAPVRRLFADFGTGPATLRQWIPVVLTWAGTLSVSWFVRRFLLQYVGDVAAYISAHTVSKFAEVRDAIQACALAVGEAVYRQADYRRVIVVGHSLGSVIAYDMLNALLVGDGLAETPLDVAGRTATFLTFGSPLDKTAFIFRAQRERPTGAREALAAAKQPMILDYRWRPARWVNIHSPSDWISGRLDYYDDRDRTECRSQWVHDEIDPEATTPLAAHNEYWHGRLLADRLYEAVTG